LVARSAAAFSLLWPTSWVGGWGGERTDLLVLPRCYACWWLCVARIYRAGQTTARPAPAHTERTRASRRRRPFRFRVCEAEKHSKRFNVARLLCSPGPLNHPNNLKTDERRVLSPPAGVAEVWWRRRQPSSLTLSSPHPPPRLLPPWVPRRRSRRPSSSRRHRRPWRQPRSRPPRVRNPSRMVALPQTTIDATTPTHKNAETLNRKPHPHAPHTLHPNTTTPKPETRSPSPMSLTHPHLPHPKP